MRPKTSAQAGPEEEGPTRRLMALGRGSKPPSTSGAKIGRATDNDIVIPDVLASRTTPRWCRRPRAPRSVDNRSINGTFVNGSASDRRSCTTATWSRSATSTWSFAGGALVRRTETEAATRTGGLEVRGVDVDHRGQQDAAGQHLDRRATGHPDRHHRAVRRRQVRRFARWSPATPPRPPAR